MNTQWKVNGSTETTSIWVEDSDGKRVCTVRNCDTDLDRARLIAAAPKLLELLIRVVDHPTYELEMRDWKEIRAAIAKAKGEA